jgi:hypothetical protein
VKQNQHAEFVESRTRSLSIVWRIADDYRVESGAVVPVMRGKPIYYPTDIHGDEGANDYMPGSRPELPGEFAKVAGGTDKEILDFVRRYGMLGYHEAWRVEELGAAFGALGYDAKVKGDPVHWILAHAANVKLVLQLANALTDPNQTKIEIQNLIVHNPETRTAHLSFAKAGRASVYPSQNQMRIFDDPRECALKIISAILNDNLTGISRGLLIEYNTKTRQPDSTPIFRPLNLLDCVYWHLTDAVIGAKIRTCENPKCRRFFNATHRRMKYCPPPMGQAGVSRCMDAAKHQAKPKQNKKRKRR